MGETGNRASGTKRRPKSAGTGMTAAARTTSRSVRLTHVDPDSGAARMVDVGEKKKTRRRAVAEGMISMTPETFRILTEGQASKGDPLATARIAGIQAAKRTADLIPLCHSLSLASVNVEFELDPANSVVRVRSEARARDRTGVEMEALTAVAVGLLTLYDMLKAVDRGMVLGDICLLEKEGGRSGRWRRQTGEASNPPGTSPRSKR